MCVSISISVCILYLERLGRIGVRRKHRSGLGKRLVGDAVHVVQTHVAEGLRQRTAPVFELSNRQNRQE